MRYEIRKVSMLNRITKPTCIIPVKKANTDSMIKVDVASIPAASREICLSE